MPKNNRVVPNPLQRGGKASPTSHSKPKKPQPQKANSKHSKAQQSKAKKAKARKSKSNSTTSERKRGGQFARHIKVLAAIHKNHKNKPFSKKMLAEWLQDDLDRDLDDLSAWYTATSAAQGAASTPLPPGLSAIKEASRDRNAERAISSLRKIGIEITRTDENGRPYKEKKKKKPSAKSNSKSNKTARTGKAAEAASSAKVWWSYDPNGQVATDLQRLFTDFRLSGYEVEGIIGCTSLLKNFYGLPMEPKVRSVFKRITAHVPPKMWRDATDEAAVWRYLFRRPGKYGPKSKLLQAWNDATILRNQCTITYASAGMCWLSYLSPNMLPAIEPRRIAAFGTLFIPEEDSIYLVGCEADQRQPGKWRRPILYKFDRVIALRMEDDPNPEFADIRDHRRIESLDGMPSRLDLEKLFADSAGAFFHYGKTHTLVMRIHDPAQIALCLERPFHRRQQVVMGPGPNEITLTVDDCFLEEVIPRLLAMKGGFTVEQPQELVDAIRAVANELAARHLPVPPTGPSKPS